MQLSLIFLDLPDPSIGSARLPPAPWEKLDEAARQAALEILARLIARMLEAEATREASPREVSPREVSPREVSPREVSDE